MQTLKILNSKEIKDIKKQLKEQFGYGEKPEYVFLMNNKNKLYVINKEIANIDLETLRIDSIGLYFGTIVDNGLRLSIEGSQIIGPKAKNNILELNKEEFEKWLKGDDFDIKTELKGLVLIKHNSEFVGCGVISKCSLLNYVPKARRLININN